MICRLLLPQQAYLYRLGIIPSVLEIVGEKSNIILTYESPNTNRTQLKKIAEGTTWYGPDTFVVPSVSMVTRHGNDDENHEECEEKQPCSVKIADSDGPVFMTKWKRKKPFDLIIELIEKCWKAIVVTLLLAGIAGILLWIAVSFLLYFLFSVYYLCNLCESPSAA